MNSLQNVLAMMRNVEQPETIDDMDYYIHETSCGHERIGALIPYLEEEKTINDPSASKKMEAIASAMGHYLKSFDAPMSVKKMLCARLHQWFLQIGRKQNIDNQELEDIFKQEADFYESNKLIDLIKHLTPDGVTKEFLCELYRTNFRTENNENQKRSIMKMLQRLSSKDNPYYIGDQPVYLEIDYKKEKLANDEYIQDSTPTSGTSRYVHRYYTKDTVHPIILQANIMQVVILLSSLCCLYNSIKGAPLALDLATDIWWQLSEYGRNRLQSIACPPQLLPTNWSDFINACNDPTITKRIFPFQREKDLINQSDASLEDHMFYLLKNGQPCHAVQYKDENGKNHILTDQYIERGTTYDNYYAVDARTHQKTLLEISQILRVVI